jgi:rifampicin phosphotransferase
LSIIYSNITHNIDLGGKANQLFYAKQQGFNVPEFVVLPYNYLAEFINKAADDYIMQKRAIETFILPQQDLQDVITYLNADAFAVRSSGADEDGAAYSFAGQYETKLFVQPNQLQDAIKQVWLSAYNDRVIAYRKENNLPLHYRINIIIQKMINSKSSGVAFGINPITGYRYEKTINTVWGIGEGLVNGSLVADQFVLGKQDVIVEKIIAVKKEQYTHNATHSALALVPVDENMQLQASINEAQLATITNALTQLEKKLQHPQDIEFAFDAQDYFWLLQTRPITTKFGEHLHVYDNSNIIESYPGLTLPLTFSFIEKMYTAVYIQLSKLLGVREKNVEKFSSIYDHMLAHIKGRVYYDLNSWYGFLALLPGYKLNARFMEKMMGVKEKYDIALPTTGSKWQAINDTIYAIRKMIKTHKNINKERDSFMYHFNEIQSRYEQIDFTKKNVLALVDLYKTYEHTMVKKWEAPLINDFFCMIYFGMLQKAIVKYKLPNPDTLHNELLAGSGDIISTEPATLLMAIIEAIKLKPELHNMFMQNTSTQVWHSIKDRNDELAVVLIKQYLHKWGARCVAELKLETITYQAQPWVFIGIIKQSLIAEKDKVVHVKTEAHLIRTAAEETAFTSLSGLRKKWFRYLLRKTRDLVSNRENLRFQRTKAFAMVRNIFTEIGIQLYAKQKLDDARDVFWLTQPEVFALCEGDVLTRYIDIINNRKAKYHIWEKEMIPERLLSYTNVHEQYFTQASTSTEQLDENTLKGLPCCAGIVRKKVSVIHSPLEISNLEGTILVTSSTDPGWVTLFPSASGILVERGSLLSHSAIVSREMGIPCIVGITNLLQTLTTGDEVEMNGATGYVTIIKKQKT